MKQRTGVTEQSFVGPPTACKLWELWNYAAVLLLHTVVMVGRPIGPAAVIADSDQRQRVEI